MKLYGSTRRDKLACRSGCCGAKAHRSDPNQDDTAVRKSLRHRARQESKALSEPCEPVVHPAEIRLMEYEASVWPNRKWWREDAQPVCDDASEVAFDDYSIEDAMMLAEERGE
jgi:hypothetical protein